MAVRLEAALQAKNGGNQSELARFIGVSPQAVQKWISGISEPRGKNLQLAAEFLGVPEQVLRYGDAVESSLGQSRRVVVTHPDMDHYPGAVYIRKVKLQLSAGILGFSVEDDYEDGEPIMLPQAFLDRKGLQADKLIVLSIKGDSMLPKMPPGTVVIINTANTIPKHDKVYAVNYKGEAVIKRLKREMGFWWLFSDNPDQERYPQQRCAGDDCIIIGKVEQSISEED